MFNNEDDEKKKKEEEAKRIISSLSPQTSVSNSINAINFSNDNNYKINAKNEQEQNFLDKINEANSIINSINPRMEGSISEPTEEERAESRRNTQKFLDLMDNDIQQAEQKEQQVQTVNSIIEDNQENIATSQQREAVNVLINKNKPENLMSDEEKQDRELQQLTNQQLAKETNSDKNLFSQIGKNIENLWLGGVSGILEFMRYITNPNHTKSQETILTSGLSAKSNNIPEEIGLLYENDLNKKDDDLLINSQRKKDILIPIYLNGESAGNVGNVKEQTNKTLIQDKAVENKLDTTIDEYTDVYGNLELNGLQRNLSEMIQEGQNKIASNTNQIDNPILKKTSELLPSTANSLVGAGISAVNPYLGMSYFIISASGSYETEGRNRGMTKEEARAYGSIMGFAEGATEMIGVSNFLKAGTALKKGAFKEALKNYGLNMADNAIQEAVIDPIDELVATVTSGKSKYDYSTKEGWEQLGSDMIKDGIDGALSSLLMDGIGASIDSSRYLYNKIRNNPESITRQDILNTYTDIQNNSDINVEEHFKNSFEYQKEKLLNNDNMGVYSILDTDSQGNVSGIKQVMGEQIEFNDSRININPVLVYDNTIESYNVIDGQTGTKLDTTPYETKELALKGFKEKITHLDNATINNINNQVAKSKMALNLKYQEMQDIMKNNPDIANQTYVTFQNDDKIYSEQDLKNLLPQQEVNTDIKDLRTIIEQIQDKSYYSSQRTNEIMKTVSDKFDNVVYTPKGNMSTLTIKDSKGNIRYSKDIKQNRLGYTGKTIRDILSNVYNYVMNGTSNANNNQTSSKPNTSNFSSNETNYAVQDIKKVTEPFNRQESYTRDEMAEIWNNEVSGNNYDAYYDKNGNIEKYIAIEEEGNNIVVNQYDNNDNVVKSEVIPSENGRYKASDIQDTLNRVASLYDAINKQNNVKKDITKKKQTNDSKTKIEKFKDIVENAITEKQPKGSLTLNKVSKKVADKIKKITGIDTLNRAEKITAFDIKHMLNQHGNEKIEKAKGQLPIGKEDILKIPDVIENYDNIVKGNLNKDKNGTHQTVRFIKQYDNHTLYVVEVVPQDGKSLIIKTMWKKPIGLINGRQTPNSTSETKTNVR